MSLLFHGTTGLPILDPEVPPFPFSYQADPVARRREFSSLILSVSGFRKVFAADGSEESINPNLTPGNRELALAMGVAYARFVKDKRGTSSPVIALGMDTRFTGPTLAEILLYALLLEGCSVRYLFILPIPELLAYVRSCPTIDGFIYVSASHNPIGHNGVKFGLREGVLGGKDAAVLIEGFQRLAHQDAEMENLLRRVPSIPPSQVEACCASIKTWKTEAEEAYRRFVFRLATGTEDPEEQERVLALLRRGISRQGCGVVIDFNGSSRSLSVDQDILRALGVKVHTLNAKPRSFQHAIIPEGGSLEPCREALEHLHRQDPSFLFGYTPDCDGDRGNLTYIRKPKGGEGKGEILEAQQVFALACVSELSYARWRNKGVAAKPRLAVVVNDPTSLRVDRIAQTLGAQVFRAEVGEANVVGLAKKLIQEGWTVPIYGEGSNGGNITFPSEVRDPLATVCSLLKILYLTSSAQTEGSPLQLWCEATGISAGPGREPDLSTLLSTLPMFTTLPVSAPEALFPIRCPDQGTFKAAYEKIFWEDWKQKRQSLKDSFGIHGWQEFNYEGMEERRGAGPAYRTGQEKGGLKVLLTAETGRPVAFLWMRKSGTEPVFRLLVDMEGTDPVRFSYLLEWHRSLIQRADQLCEGQGEGTMTDVFYQVCSLVGMNIRDERLNRVGQNLWKSAIPWESLLPKGIGNAEVPRYLSIPDRGLQLLVNPKGVIQTVFLFQSAQEGFTPFSWGLLDRSAFPTRRGELRALLGEPVESGESREGFLSETETSWDVFRYLNVRIHAGYGSKDLDLLRLTISPFEEG